MTLCNYEQAIRRAKHDPGECPIDLLQQIKFVPALNGWALQVQSDF